MFARIAAGAILIVIHAAFVCCSQERRPDQDLRSSQQPARVTTKEQQPSQVLGRLLLALNPAIAFNACGAGAHCGTRNAFSARSRHAVPDRRLIGQRTLTMSAQATPEAPEAERTRIDSSALTQVYVQPELTVSQKAENLMVAYSGQLPDTDLTTHEGQKRLLESKSEDGEKPGAVLPVGILSPKAAAKDFLPGEGQEVLDKGFPWQENEFLEGSTENAKILEEYERLFEKQTGCPRPHWNGLEMAFDDPENLRAGLDLSVAYLKNHALDKCEMLMGKYVLPACLARGMPWVVKAMQDFATLRMKQNRNAESMLVLEELERLVPPHPIMMHNLGLAYNSVRMHDKAMEQFEKAIAINGGTMKYDDYLNIGITHMHTGEFDSAFAMQQKALEMAIVEPDVDEVTLGKIFCSIGWNVMQASEVADTPQERKRLVEEAETYIREAVYYYNVSSGATNHYGTAVYDMCKCLVAQDRCVEAEPYLHEAMYVTAHKDGIHPTVCHYQLESLLDLYHKGALPKDQLSKYHDLLRDMLMNLHMRGFAKDGNGGVVMKGIAEFFMLSGAELAKPALALLKKGLELVEKHDKDVKDTSVLEWIIKMEIEKTEQLTHALPPPREDGTRVERKNEGWLLQGPWGAPEGSEVALGLLPEKATR